MLPEENGRAEPGRETVPFAPFARVVEGVAGLPGGGAVEFWAAEGDAAGLEKTSSWRPRDNRKMALHATGQHKLASLGFLLYILEEK